MPNRESSLNQQQDYIDVISIGTLYDPNGRWHKKYWSSSRGRERHPYPIGYEATRTYNGVNSTMRILQGDTGPLFQITSVDGHTASGPTPDIAWKEFQRASSPLALSIRTKRLSASIDGTEFFGFKYNTVQQLLRQLVTAAASQGTCVSNAHQNKQIPKQRHISAASNDCSQDKGAEKRKIDCMESISNNKLKKVRPLKDTSLSTSYRNNEICKYINSLPTAAPATADFDKSHPIKTQEVDDEKICSSLAADMLDGCEEVTMSMMKLLLPQAVPFLRKARGTKIKTDDVSSVDGMNTDSICQDYNKTREALESSKDIIPESFNTMFDEHNNLDKLHNVPDSCNELDDNACVQDSCDELDDNACFQDSYDELDNNAFVPDSCDKLEENAYAPDSCDELDAKACAPDCNAYVPDPCDELEDNVFAPDICIELDKNAYAPDSCDELDENAEVLYSGDKLDENAQVPDLCDEHDDKEIVPDSPQQLNENNYVSDSSDKLDGNLYAPKSFVDMDEKENVPISAKQLTHMNVKICEGRAVSCSLESEKILSAKYVYIHEATKETSDPEIFSTEGVCGARFCEEEGNNNNDYLKHQGQSNLATQQQIKNTNQTNHMRIANASTDELHCGICPVFSNGSQSALDRCASKANFNAGSYGACAPSDNLYEKVVKAFDNGCSQSNDGHCSDEIIMPADIPHGTNFLHDKTHTCGSDEYFSGTQKPPGSDVVNNEQFMLNDGNVSSSEILRVEQSAHVDDSNASSCVGEAKLIITKEPEKKLSGFGRHVGVHIYGNEMLTKSNNASSTPQTLLHKLSASIDDSYPSAGTRTLDAQYSKLSTVTENENGSSCSEKFAELPEWDMVTDEEFLMCEKIASSMIEALHHKQLTSLHDINKSTGCTALDGNKLTGFGKLIGLYEHPKPVLSVLICSNGSETYICTSCGTLENNQRTLFMYTLKVEGTSAGPPGRPYFVGHSPMLLPDAKCFLGRQIALDKSGMQFTPSGQNVVLLNGMQFPSCRIRVMQCRCLECETYSCEENGVKIVQLNDGYVTVLAKLKTVHSVLCLLVCEPDYLVAVEANGAFRFWTMDSTWRYAANEFILPPTDCISPCAIELKQIPNCPHLVVGHNCLGEFGLWDVSRHTIISRFFTPDSAVFRFIPLGLYQMSRKDKTFICLNTNEQPYSLKNNNNLNLTSVNDVAISILVATRPDIKNSYRPMPDECWKLGLLMNNKVVLNHSHALDARAVSVASFGDCGVLGTNQGYLHVWDLYSGLKLGASLCFKDGRVECLYTDNARSGLMAVADDKGKLLLYSSGEERETL